MFSLIHDVLSFVGAALRWHVDRSVVLHIRRHRHAGRKVTQSPPAPRRTLPPSYPPPPPPPAPFGQPSDCKCPIDDSRGLSTNRIRGNCISYYGQKIQHRRLINASCCCWCCFYACCWCLHCSCLCCCWCCFCSCSCSYCGQKIQHRRLINVSCCCWCCGCCWCCFYACCCWYCCCLCCWCCFCSCSCWHLLVSSLRCSVRLAWRMTTEVTPGLRSPTATTSSLSRKRSKCCSGERLFPS